MSQITSQSILEMGTIIQAENPDVYEHVRSNILSLFRSGISVSNDGEGTLVISRLKSENKTDVEPKKESQITSFKGKLHKHTANVCLICSEKIKDDSFILHKTRRQTHSLCFECAEGYIKPIAENITDQIRRGVRTNKTGIFQCPGNIDGEYRNLCSCKLNIKKVFETNYEQTHIYVKKCEAEKCKKVIFVPYNEYINKKGFKVCKCSHFKETLKNYSERTGINTIIPPRLNPGSDLATMIFRIKYVLDDPNRHICPNRQCGMVIDSEPHIQHIICDNCETSFCRNCNVSPYHKNMSCLTYESSQSETEDGKYKWNLYREGDLKDCPECFAPTLKRSGCNKMWCERCNTKWCWICREADIDYSHFNNTGTGNCSGRLWEGTEGEDYF